MPTVDIDDATIHYERSGSGPAILFVHGMCGDADVWADQAHRAQVGHMCVRYDRRGHSRSGRGRGPVSPSRHADDAAALIEALELAPCLVVGSSGGAVIALDVARRHAHLLDGVLLSEPPLFGIDPSAGEAFVSGLRRAIDPAMATGGAEAAIDAFFAYACPNLWASADDHAKGRYRANAEIGLEDLWSPPLEVTLDDLGAMTVPALVMTGTDSHPAFRSVAGRLAGVWPGARLVELEESGHVTYFEQPAQFGTVLAGFAADLARGRRPVASGSARVRAR